MPPDPRALRPTWTRRVQGWSFLLFFVSLIVLTVAAVEFWNAGDMVTTGYVAGLASVLPLLLVVLVYFAVPLWGISVPLPPETVANVVASAAPARNAEPVPDPSGPFGHCPSVVRLPDPRCLVGWFPEPAGPGARSGTVVLLKPESRDRKALAALRESLAESLRTASRPAAYPHA